MINFNNLPNDIKGLIFKHNRISAETEKNKIKFNDVMTELQNYDELTMEYYMDVVYSGEDTPEEIIKLAPPWGILLLEYIKVYRIHYPEEYFD